MALQVCKKRDTAAIPKCNQTVSAKCKSIDRETRLLVTLHGRAADAGMQGSIVGAHIVPQEGIELRQGSNGIHVQRIKPCFFQCPELALDFGFVMLIFT